MDDKLLIKKAKKGDKNAFIELLRFYEKDIYLLAKYLLKDEELIKDAVQETILITYEKIESLKNDSSFKSWLLKILGNKCRDILKSQKKIICLDKKIDGEYIDSGYEAIEINQCINKLCEEHKQVIILYYFNDLSYKEISSVISIPEGTVKSRLSRAKESLKELLIREEINKDEFRQNSN